MKISAGLSRLALLFFAGAALSADPAWAQAIGQTDQSLVSPWRVAAALVFCLVLGAGAIMVLRRRFGSARGAFPGTGATKRIRLLEQHYLGPQRSICLIEIDDRSYAAVFAAQAVSLVPMTVAGTVDESAL